MTMQLNKTETESRTVSPVETQIERLTKVAVGWLSAYSIDILRISLGVVFLVFGVLKFFPGVSPAQELAVRTVETLTFGMVNGGMALILIAAMETFIGITLVTGKFLRVGLAVLGMALVGIMSPLVLFFGDLVPGAPTLDAQYVFKDIVLAAGGLVIAAKALGARLTPSR